MRSWTLIFPYYENPAMLRRQLDWLTAWPEDMRKHLELIVVDDGSPKSPAIEVFEEWAKPYGDLLVCELPFAVRLFRIGVDVRWNWLACRNLAMQMAAHHWRLMTDIDHLVPLETALYIATGKLKDKHIYRFERQDWPALTPYKPHPNSWLMTGPMFEKTGGYDERFSGFYGTDGMFRDRCTAAASRVILLPAPLLRVSREEVPDASTTTYGRKEQQDREGVQRIRAGIISSGDLTPKRGLFPWTEIL